MTNSNSFFSGNQTNLLQNIIELGIETYPFFFSQLVNYIEGLTNLSLKELGRGHRKLRNAIEITAIKFKITDKKFELFPEPNMKNPNSFFQEIKQISCKISALSIVASLAKDSSVILFLIHISPK
ncbi:MAG: hypothetical protein EOP45_07000, partial [Sphingobacteriaceae bacterium]